MAHASVPVLLALYGYNRGYLDVILQNPPAGVPSMADTLDLPRFLDCSSSAFPLQIATSYDTALTNLADPPNLPWLEMTAWANRLETATGRAIRLGEHRQSRCVLADLLRGAGRTGARTT